MARQCVTHHDACDCREAKVRALVEAVAEVEEALLGRAQYEEEASLLGRAERLRTWAYSLRAARLAALASPPPPSEDIPAPDPWPVEYNFNFWDREQASIRRELLALRRVLALTEAVAQAAREQRNLFRSHRLCDCWRCLEAGPALDAALAAYDAAKERANKEPDHA